MKTFGFGTLLEDYYRSHMRSAGGGHDQLVAFRRKNVPFLDDKPERADEKEAAFRRFLLNWVPGFSAKPRGPAEDPCVIRGRTRYAKRLRPSHVAAPIFVRHLAVSRASRGNAWLALRVPDLHAPGAAAFALLMKTAYVSTASIR
jgi:hypothetical protein